MRRYLFVDDNVAHAENLAEILRDTGATADVADGAERALALVGKHVYDAVVTDMRMPDTDGASLLRALRKLDPGLPAVLASAYTTEGDLAAARREGVLAVLPKPVPVRELVGLLARARRFGTICVVEDDQAFCDELAAALAASGFTVVAAHSIQDAARLPRPFLGLVDVYVPGGPPGAGAAALRARWPGLPVVVVTGHAEFEPVVDCLEVLPKPLRVARLLDLVEKAWRGPVPQVQA